MTQFNMRTAPVVNTAADISLTDIIFGADSQAAPFPVVYTFGALKDFIGAVAGAVTSVAGKTGVVSLIKNDVGLAFVDDTADLSKPISTLQAAAFAGKENQGFAASLITAHVALSDPHSQYARDDEKGVANGIATLGADGLLTLAQRAPGGGGVTDGNKGDITVSGTGANWQISAGAVTLADMASIATATFLGRITAGTGVVESLTATQATSLLDVFTSTLKGLVPLSGGGTTGFLRADGTWAVPAGGGGVTDGNKGDITVSSAGANWQINAGAVTLTKMANIATGSFLGRVTAGTGVVESLTAAQVKAALALVRGDVGLGNVDNTSDVSKPVSTAQAAADALLIPLTQRAAASGVATLDTNTRIPIVQQAIPPITVVPVLDIAFSPSARDFTKTVAATSTFTFSGTLTAGNLTWFVLKLKVTTATQTITWPTNVRWFNSPAPTTWPIGNYTIMFDYDHIDAVWAASSTLVRAT